LYYVRRQVAFVLLGLVAFFAGTQLTEDQWRDHALRVWTFALGVLFLVWIPGIGTHVGGATRWFRIGGVQIQPAEFVKVALLAFLARQMVLKPGRVMPVLVGVLPVCALLLLQPDFGTTALLGLTAGILLYVGGLPRKKLVTIWVVAVGLLGLIAVAKPYRVARLVSFWNPWSDPSGSGFQVIQSMLGLSQGRFFGVGLGNGREKLFFLPEAHNDFIFAVIGEELGFMGTAMVLSLFLLLVIRGFVAASRCRSSYSALLAAGVSTLFGLQAIVNMGVVMGLLPTKGMTLPFVSYGGSAMVVNLFLAGVLLRLGRA
jgi:cell division protein FtsW